MSVAGNRRNRAGLFTTMRAGATIRNGSASIAAEHSFARDAIETKYKISRGAATSITMRMPVWGKDSTVDLLRGARVSGKQIIRTSGAMLIRGTTPDGGVMLVAFRGIPNKASIVVVRHNKSSRAPKGARELRIKFKADKGMTLERRIAVVAAAPER
jgi:hypothetical protein